MFRAAVLAALTLLAAAEIAAGEESTPGPFSAGDWAEAQENAGKSPLVVIARVVEAAGAKGKGWNMQARGDNNRAPVDVQQECTVEVVEVLRGEPKASKLVVRLNTVQYPLQSLYRMLMVSDGKRTTRRQSVPAGEFALVKDRTYLLFLSAPKDAEARDPVDSQPDTDPVEAPDAQLLASVRGFCRALAAWKDPPKLAPEEDARVRQLVADLGADDFEKRERAEADLRKLGAAVRTYLEAAARDKDPERSFRAKDILKAAEPMPGQTELPFGEAVGGTAKSGTVKNRPKEEPLPEIEGVPEPAPAPAPEPEALPELPAAVD